MVRGVRWVADKVCGKCQYQSWKYRTGITTSVFTYRARFGTLYIRTTVVLLFSCDELGKTRSSPVEPPRLH